MTLYKKHIGDDYWGSVEVEIEKISIEADTDGVVRIHGREISHENLRIFTEILLAILEHGMEGLIDYGEEE